jgi:nitrite transporter NirC
MDNGGASKESVLYMEQAGVVEVSEIAKKKMINFNNEPMRFFIYSMMAGVFCGFGMILAYSAGGALANHESTVGFAKIVFGISFALSFTLIVYAGSELFTGNVGVMTIGVLNRLVTLKDGIKLACFVYLGNFLGATLIALLIGAGGLLDNPEIANYIVSSAATKMQLPIMHSFARGILCNMMVVLATWCCAKLRSEPAKMMILVWCVYGFCTSGFEHSIANMALFVMSMITPFTTPEISLAGTISNIIPVTLGNIVGGGAIGAVYYYLGSGSGSKIEPNKMQTLKTDSLYM